MVTMQDKLVARLRRLDEDIALLNTHKVYQIVLAGSAALILQNAITRMTQDIDALSVSREITGLLDRYDIDTHVSAYLDHFAYDYENRLVKMELGCHCLQVYALCLEDLVISKLNTERDKDYLDITSPDVLGQLDWSLLDKIACSEVEQSALNTRRYNTFVHNYERYKRECGVSP